MVGVLGWGAGTGPAIDGAPSVNSVLEPWFGLGDVMVDGVSPLGVRPLSVLGSLTGGAGSTRDGRELVAGVMNKTGGP